VCMHTSIAEGSIILCAYTLQWQREILFCVYAKVGKENIFKPTIGQESLHQDSNDFGVRIVNFTTSKSLVVKIEITNRFTALENLER